MFTDTAGQFEFEVVATARPATLVLDDANFVCFTREISLQQGIRPVVQVDVLGTAGNPVATRVRVGGREIIQSADAATSPALPVQVSQEFAQ